MMRDYSKVSPQFWIGKTGKALRAQGIEAQVVAMYLLTCPHANMLGLYYLPVMYIAHEVGLPLEGASKGLRRASEAGFCSYDETAEVVWVHEMAKFQVGGDLKPSDNRIKGVQNEYESLPENAFLSEFYEKYADVFQMTKRRQSTSPLQAPCKPLRSQEQEQEQEQAQKQEQVAAPAAPALPAKPKAEAKSAGSWAAYSEAYCARYGAEPVRNAKVNSLLGQLVDRIGAEEAPLVAAYYVHHPSAFYVQRGHSVECLIADCEKLRTEWATGRKVTQTQARQQDKTASNPFLKMLEDRQREESQH